MSYFNETLPRLLIDAYTKQYTQAQDNSRIQNLTALPNNAVKAAWSDAGAQLVSFDSVTRFANGSMGQADPFFARPEHCSPSLVYGLSQPSYH